MCLLFDEEVGIEALVKRFGGPLHKVGEAGRGVLLHDDEEAVGVAVGGLGGTGIFHTS